ncbi:DoxX family protein [Herbaspirillum lusitanum]|uniref:DoxX family protein n=1 Tax=Herbaspirillum lusitanum TaxID=213312 RepID=UPI0003171D64|nr:DoxX family protein [Herbaspirillum lusitanum]
MQKTPPITIAPGAGRFIFPALMRWYARGEGLTYALLRFGYGAIIFTHGLPKALGVSHGSMADPMAGSIRLIGEVMGLPFAPQLAFLVMLLETVGAAMLALGLLTRPLALLMFVEMIAISYAMGPTWPWIDRGIEYPVLLGLAALYMMLRGGGAWSLDSRIRYEI